MTRMRKAILFGLAAVFSIPSALTAEGIVALSAASYQEQVSPGSLAVLFGEGLAPQIAVGQADRDGQLPRQLAGVQVKVDGRPAGLAFVSSNQINLVVPEDAAVGSADVEVSVAGQGVTASGSMQVAIAAPGLFSVDGSGSGAGALINAITESVGPFTAQTAENPGCDKRTQLLLFATGIRFADNPNRLPRGGNVAQFVHLSIEDSQGKSADVEDVEYAGPSEEVEGVDQVKFTLPAGFTDPGDYLLRLDASGAESNRVGLHIDADTEDLQPCTADGFAVAFNTVTDLLAGDLWDVSMPDAVAPALSQVPGDWPLMGIGTTAEAGHNGEVIAYGTAAKPELVWADPQFPFTVRTLSTEPIPFLGVAAGDPATAIVVPAEPGRPIHEQIVELAESRHLAFAGVRVSGSFSEVSHSVAHNLLKQGTPLTDPTVDKAPYQLFFDEMGDAQWEMSGFYAASLAAQEIVSVRGAPVHLHGFQSDRSRAGHIGSATVAQATISLYPLKAPVVEDADLAVRRADAGAGQVAFEVVNLGNTTVSHTTVQGIAGDEVVFQFELPAMESQEVQRFEMPAPTGLTADGLRIVVDPFNDVLESDEWNNVLYLYDFVAPSASATE